jgi:hypothetical protein
VADVTGADVGGMDRREGAVIKKVDPVDMSLRPEKLATAEDAVSFVDNLYAESRRVKWPFERQWFINANFYLGRQYVVPNDVTRKFDTPLDPPHRVRHVVNKIKPYVITKISKLTRQEPHPEASPASNDFDDIQKARLANSLMAYWAGELKLQTLLNELFLWVCITGNGFLRPFWNTSKGRAITVKKGSISDQAWVEIGGQLMAAEILDKVNQLDIPEGDVDMCVVSPFSGFAHPKAKSLAESIWFLESNVRDTDSLYEQWGSAANEVSVDGGEDDWRDFEQRLLGSTNQAPGELIQNTKHGHFPSVTEKQLWVRPCRAFPNGKYVVVAGGKCLHMGDFPFTHGRLPYIHFKDDPVPGRFWGQSSIEDLIPIQKSINSKKSKLHEVFNLHAKPTILNPKGSGVPNSDFTNRPGDVLQVNPDPNVRPSVMAPAPLPQYTENLVQADMNDFEECSGQHEATRGIAPGRVDSAQGIVSLQEADDTRLGPQNRSSAEALGESFDQLLCLGHQFYTEPRLIKVAGQNAKVEVREFIGADLAPKQGFNGRFDVRLRMGSGLPMSRSARTAYVIQLADKGILNKDNPQDRELIFKILELGGPSEAIFQNAENARAQAHIENAEMAAGIMHSPNTWDVHPEHLDVHETYRRRPEFMQEIEKNPQIGEIFEAHIRATEQAMAVDQMRKAQLTQGAPPAPPAQPPPPMLPAPGGGVQ